MSTLVWSPRHRRYDRQGLIAGTAELANWPALARSVGEVTVGLKRPSVDGVRITGPSTATRRGTSSISLVLVAALLLAVLALTEQPSAAAGEAVAAGELRVTPTLDHIGVVWFVNGDSDRDSSMTIEYRRSGHSTWRPGAPAMRAEPNVIVDGNSLGINSWAASAMFLERGTNYEIRAVLTDPDGGSETRVVDGTTRTMLEPTTTLRYVAPGSGGGSGTQPDPYLGLQTAANNAQPGQTFIVAPGTYSPFQLTTSGTAANPISFVGPADGTAIVDGAGTDRGVITIGTFDSPTSNVIVSGLSIRNGLWGIDAQRTQNIVVAENIITDVGWGIYNRRAQNDERYQVVCDNVIEGRVSWPASGIPGERGIDLRGWGNTVCNNEVSNFGDCVSVQPIHGASFGNDIFGNDANRCVDDGIEIDYNQANVRVYRNRVTNSRIGVSVQPIYGGPAYIFRNELFNLENSTIKLNNGPAGLFIAHNTGIKTEQGVEDGSVFNNTVFRNNLILGTRYAFEFTSSTSAGSRDFDFGAWGTSRGSGPWFKWNNERYDRIADLPNGVEDNGIDIDMGAVVSGSLPASWDVEVAVGSRDLRPSSGSPVINAGTNIANLNSPFVTDNAPDSGAFEAGQPLPSYGPGTPLIDPPTSDPDPEPTPSPTPTPPAVPTLCYGRVVTINMNEPGVTGQGTPGDDVILGTPGPDVISSGGGADTVCGLGGDDVITATGSERKWILGGEGDDDITAGAAIDIIFGQGGADTIRGGGGTDHIWAGPGNDQVFAGSGADRVYGGDGDDTLMGMGGQDFMFGQAGNDLLQGSWQSDRLYGGPGNDVLEGARGKDKLYGGPGNDRLYGGINTDFLDGGDGIDEAYGQAGKDNPLIINVSGCIAETQDSC